MTIDGAGRYLGRDSRENSLQTCRVGPLQTCRGLFLLPNGLCRFRAVLGIVYFT